MSVRIVTADDLCRAAQQVLTQQLPGLLTELGLTGDDVPRADRYEEPKTWAQVPTLEALQAASTPAAAITSTGTVGEPRRSSLGYDATWRIRVGIFDRGHDYDNTAARARTWAALVRAVLVLNPTLGGVATSTRWVGETYRQFPQVGAARTLGGCAVDVDVTARNVIDLGPLDPSVLTTQSDLTVR